jgi:hypothetical protein
MGNHKIILNIRTVTYHAKRCVSDLRTEYETRLTFYENLSQQAPTPHTQPPSTCRDVCLRLKVYSDCLVFSLQFVVLLIQTFLVFQYSYHPPAVKWSILRLSNKCDYESILIPGIQQNREVAEEGQAIGVVVVVVPDSDFIQSQQGCNINHLHRLLLDALILIESITYWYS